MTLARSGRSSVRTGTFLLLPALAYFTIITFFPEAYSVYISTFRWFFPSPPEFVGPGNYVDLAADSLFYSSLGNTVIWLVLVLGIETFLGLGIALLLRRETKVAKFGKVLMIIPLMMPPVVVAQLWKYVFDTAIGPMNYFLSGAGLPQPNWLGSLPYAWYILVFVDVWQWTPFLVLIALAALYGIQRDILQAAELDGASSFQLLREVELPLILPVMFIGILLRAADLLGSYANVALLTKGNPGQGTWLLSFFIYYKGFSGALSIGYGAASSVVVLLIALGIMITFFFLFTRVSRR